MAVDTQAVEIKPVRKNGEVVLDLIQGLWTETQYQRLTDQTNQLIEFTDRSIEILPMSTRTHQLILTFLY